MVATVLDPADDAPDDGPGGSPVARFGAAIDALDAALADAPPVVLGGELVALERERRRLDALWIERVRRFDRSGQAQVDGVRSTAAWLAHHTHRDSGVMGADVRLGRRLEQMPATERAFRDGEISHAHARTIAHGVDVDGFDQAEAGFVETARRTAPKRLGEQVQAWKSERHDRPPRASRPDRLQLSQTFGQCWALDGWLRPEAGALVRRALDDLVARFDPATTGPMCRSAARAMALEMLCDRYLRGALGRPRHRPHISILIDHDTFVGLRAGHGIMEDGTILTAERVRHLAADATVSRIVMADGLPLDVGHAHRTAPTGCAAH